MAVVVLPKPPKPPKPPTNSWLGNGGFRVLGLLGFLGSTLAITGHGGRGRNHRLGGGILSPVDPLQEATECGRLKALQFRKTLILLLHINMHESL